MEEHRTDPLVAAFLSGYLRCISKQMAGISRGQDMHQASMERLILMTGQLLEASRMAQSPQTSGPSMWSGLHDWSKRIELAHKLYRLLVWSRIVLWPAYVIGGMRYLGWL